MTQREGEADVVTVGVHDETLTESRETRFATGYFLYAFFVGGAILLLNVIGLQAARSISGWLWGQVAAAAFIPTPMVVTGCMLLMKPLWGRRIAFMMALITLVCAALYIQMGPKFGISALFDFVVFAETLNFPGAAFLGLFLCWPNLQSAFSRYFSNRKGPRS